MQLKNLVVLLFMVFLSFTGHAQSKIYGQNLSEKEIWVEGYINTVPRFYSGQNGKYQSWTFNVNASADRVHGDEFIMVTFHTVKWGKKVGDFNYSKGQKVKLYGRYVEFKGARRGTGIVGSLKVNDLSLKDLR